MRTLQNLLFATNCQKILSFLIQNPDREYFDVQVAKLTGVSRAGANFALRRLSRVGLISREKRGRMCFNRVRSHDVLIRYLKILQNIAALFPLVDKLRETSLRVVLYGSASRGENVGESDIDLFILTRTPDEVEAILFKDKLREKVQYVIRTPDDLVRSKKKNSAFYREIEGGIILSEHS